MARDFTDMNASKGAADSKAAAALQSKGRSEIRESARRSMAAASAVVGEDLTIAAVTDQGYRVAVESSLSSQVAKLIQQAKGIQETVYETPVQVLTGIEGGALNKGDAVKYAIKLNLIGDMDPDDITPKQAIAMLKKASGEVETENEVEVIAQEQSKVRTPITSKIKEELKVEAAEEKKEEPPKEEKKEEPKAEEKKEDKKEEKKDDKKPASKVAPILEKIEDLAKDLKEKESAEGETGDVAKIDKILELLDDAEKALPGGTKDEKKEEAGAPKPTVKMGPDVPAPPVRETPLLATGLEPKPMDLKPPAGAPLPPSPTFQQLGASYSVKLEKDANVPIASAWTVYNNGSPVLRVSAQKAFKHLAEERIDAFLSDEYGMALKASLDTEGLEATIKKHFGEGEFATVLTKTAQQEPPKNIRVDEDKIKELTKPVADLPPLATTLLELLSTVIANTKGFTADQAIEELVSILTDPQKKGQFLGALKEKVEQAIAKQEAPPASEGGIRPSPPEPKKEGAPPPVAAAPTTPAAQSTPPQQNQKSARLAVALEQELVKTVNENDNLKKELKANADENLLRIRAIRGKQLAAQMVEVGLIDDKDIPEKAIDLAGLSDEQFRNEQKIVATLRSRREVIAEKFSNRQASHTVIASVGVPAQEREIVHQDIHGDDGKGRREQLGWSRPGPLPERR
jgi:hypothetical protein